MGDPANEHDDDPHGDDDHDEAFVPPPDRLDRVWLHPTELPPPPKPRRARAALAGIVRPLAIGAVAAFVTVAVLAAVGAFDDSDTVRTPFASGGQLNDDASGAPGGNVGQAVVALRIYDENGARRASGICVRHGGEILTSARAIGSATTVTVTTSEGETLEATVTGRDDTTDMALLSVTSPVPAITVADDVPVAGDPVWILGGPMPGTGQTWRSSGIMASTAATVIADPGPMYARMFETDAPMSATTAGAALVNAEGKVTGVVLAPVSGSQMTYVLPIADALAVAKDLRDDGMATHGALGLVGLDSPMGPIVTEIELGGAAAAGGIAVGDVITAVDGREVLGMGELTALIRSHRVGTSVELAVLRGERHIGLDVRLGGTAGPGATFVSVHASMDAP